MDASKVTGPGEIQPAIVRLLAEVLVKPCTQLFNAPLDERAALRGQVDVGRHTSV